MNLSDVGAISSAEFGQKDQRDEKVNYAKFRADVGAVAKHFGIDARECWALAKMAPLPASRAYRTIAWSLRAGE